LKYQSAGVFEGQSPSKLTIFPLSFEGEGDKGGEDDRQINYI
jgi:hypothetical protein